MSADTLAGDETRAIAHRFGERGADGEISAFERRLLIRAAAEREHFDAGQGGGRGAQVLAFVARDLGDRAQEDRGRDRQLDRQRRQSERAADRAGRCGGKLMGAVGRLGPTFKIEGPQRQLQRAAEGGLGRMRDRAARRLRHGAAQELDRSPDDVGQALRETRPFQASDRPPQIVSLLARQSRGHDLDGRHRRLSSPPGDSGRAQRDIGREGSAPSS